MDDILYDDAQGLYYKLCAVCNKRICNKYRSQIKQRTCSHSCQFKGNTFRKGKRPTNAFKKGERLGSDNLNWKGDNATYGSKHDWIARHYGKPNICEVCGDTQAGSRKYQWANISGKHLRDRSDWKRMCAKCHYYYDNRHKILERYQKSPIKNGRANKTGFKNVRITRSNKYAATITINGKVKRIGSYETPQQAYEAYKDKALELYGKF